ncbi:unnamed protein product [Prunus brigantina]
MKVLGLFVKQCWLCMVKSVMNVGEDSIDEIRVTNLRVELVLGGICSQTTR